MQMLYKSDLQVAARSACGGAIDRYLPAILLAIHSIRNFQFWHHLMRRTCMGATLWVPATLIEEHHSVDANLSRPGDSNNTVSS